VTTEHEQARCLAVELHLYKPEHREALAAFYLPDEQAQFTGMPEDMIRKSQEDPHRHPIVILQDSRPVGFFILYDGEEIQEYTPNPKALLLRAFSINHADQGKGYAKKGLLHLREFANENFPAAEEITLAVNYKNIPAKNLYLACGFQDKGQTRIGPKGPQHVLSLPLR
jgi:GNAT superfamily N-acetyltransferase